MSDAHADEIAKLEALYEENPEGRVFTHLAEAYRKAGELDRARAVLVEGIERHPDYSSAHVVLGRVLRGLDRSAEAESEFLRVLELDSHNLIALRALGDLARDRGDGSTALSYYQRLAELEPSEEVQEVIADLSRGTDGAEEPEGAEEADPWASVPGAHVRSEEHAEADHREAAEAGHELMDIGELEEQEVGGAEVTEEPAWSTEAGAEVGDEYGGWVGGVGDREGEAGFDEVAAEDEGTPPGATTEEELAIGGGPWVSGAPGEGEQAGEEASPEDTAGVTTETIAQVYARQGLYDRAADVYRELLRSRPDDEGLRDRLAEMEQLATAREERPEEEPMAVSGAEDADEEYPIEGFETEEVDLGAATAEPVSGLEVQDADPETGLIVEATPDRAEVTGGSDASGVTEEPGAGDSPWASAEEDEAVPAAEAEDETLGSVWTGSDWGEAAEAETPHAWAEDAGEPDETPPIREYFGGLLSWSGTGEGSSRADEAVATEPAETTGAVESVPETGGAVSEAPPSAGSEPDLPERDTPEREAGEPMESAGTRPTEDEDDDDLDMFRSWLESLKQ